MGMSADNKEYERLSTTDEIEIMLRMPSKIFDKDFLNAPLLSESCPRCTFSHNTPCNPLGVEKIFPISRYPNQQPVETMSHA